MNDPPLISVLIIAYNREGQIAEALDSVLCQEGPFSLEIVIGEDCSTDGTREVIRGYRDRHPELIRPTFRPRNVGPVANYALTLKACRGRYVALLDADDYWLSADKLRKQLAFLEQHPQCSFCFHNTRIVYEDGTPPHPRITKDLPALHSLEDVATTFRITTSSVLFRADLIGELPDWYYSMPTGDWPLFVLIAHHGPAGYLAEILGAYRRHAGGYWTTMDPVTRLERSIQMMDTVSRHTAPALRRKIRGVVARSHWRAFEQLRARHRPGAGRHLWAFFRINLTEAMKYYWLLTVFLAPLRRRLRST